MTDEIHQEVQDTRRDAIEAAFASAETASAETSSAEATEQPSAAPERAREDNGRFAGEKPAETVEDAPVEKPKRSWHKTWKKEAAERLDSLDPNEYGLILEEIERRESDYHKGLEPYKESAQNWQQFKPVIDKHMRTFQQYNISPAQAIEHLLNADAALRYGSPEQKQQYFNQLANDYGIQLNQYGEMEQGDPALQTVLQKQQQIEQTVRNILQSQQKNEYATIAQDLEKFKADKPHFEELRDTMADLLQIGKAKDLNDAYEQAQWLNPDIRERVLAEKAELAEKQRRESAVKAAQSAKAAGVSVKGAAPSGMSSAANPNDRRAYIESLVNGGGRV